MKQKPSNPKRNRIPAGIGEPDLIKGAVHIDFFDEYLEEHLSPFAQEFARRSEKLGEVFLDGGEVPNLDSWSWNEIQKWSGAPARR